MTSSILNNMVASAKRNHRRGLTLIEAAMVLGILAAVIAAALLLYSSANSSRQVQQLASQLGMIQEAARSAYGSQSSYNGMTSATIASFLPASMSGGANDHLNSAFNSPITITSNAADADADFTVQVDNIPYNACQKLAVMDLGRATLGVTIGGNAETLPVTVAAAQKDCGNTGQVTMIWDFQ